jgi:hypothetical protein
MPVKWEGNWMPQLVGEELRLIYSVDPTRILSNAGAVLYNEPTIIRAETFRGGSQAVPFDDGWLMIIHEVEHINGGRQYFHRFIWIDQKNSLRRLSQRFYFHHRGYEFVAGMDWHPDRINLVITFSINDADQTISLFNSHDVRMILLDVSEHRPPIEESVPAGRAALAKLIGHDNLTKLNWEG